MTSSGGQRRLCGDGGASLMELLVVMALSSVVLAFVAGAVVNAITSQRRQTAQVAALNDTRLAFERVTRDIRGADLKVAEVDRIRLDVRRPGAAARTVTYQRVGGRLVATEAATGVTRDLVGDLAPGQPLFLFHLGDGSTVTGALTANLREVHSITVRLQVDPKGAGRVVDLANRVRMRNAPL